ncbi:alpha/beta hydrolase fold domain-containing protein [Primorskyibacter sp. S187A]|uniref:alpha/beta hydrolase fold domain-containing protein n=1 Tax=Primorskyibacter sp. S187A TaxID=3415130 RepID=UPI003C7E00CC
MTRKTYGGVEGLEIAPEGHSGPASVLYMHGGGFTIGSARTHKWMVARIAKASGRSIFSVDYRLAPKHPFPAAVDDCEAAFDALAVHGPVAVAGDSAGGCLALGLCATRRPERAVLLSPVVDFAGGEGDYSREILLPRAWVNRAFRHYAAGADPADPRLSPIRADLSAAPPMLVEVAEGEMLESHSRRVLEVIPHARLEVTPGVAHVWQLNAGWMAQADASVARIGAFLRAGL